MIRVVVADDHPVVRKGLIRALENQPDLKVVGETSTGDGLLSLLDKAAADVAIVDISMPGPGFLDVIRHAAKNRPGVKTIVLSVHDEEQYALQAFRAGASGYVMKDRPLDEVVQAIRRVHAGERYASGAVEERLSKGKSRAARAATAPHEVLSPREFDVMSLLGAGKGVKEIAEALKLSPKTVSTFRARILKKMAFKSNADIVRYMLEHRMLS